MTIKFTGVGSRKVQPPDGLLLFRFGVLAAEAGYVLRSGGAPGCDSYFEEGCDEVGGQKEIYTPDYGFNGNLSPLFYQATPPELLQKAEEIVSKIHPNWKACNGFAKRAHTRNVFQVLGADLQQPSAFLICWTEGGEAIGGTATAINLAKAHGIPVYNTGKAKTRQLIERWVDTRALDVPLWR